MVCGAFMTPEARYRDRLLAILLMRKPLTVRQFLNCFQVMGCAFYLSLSINGYAVETRSSPCEPAVVGTEFEHIAGFRPTAAVLASVDTILPDTGKVAYATYTAPYLDIYNRGNPEWRPFICCDIQYQSDPVDLRVMHGGIQVNRFIIPENHFVELQLIDGEFTNGRTLYLYNNSDMRQYAYLSAFLNIDRVRGVDSDIREFKIPEFDRNIYIYQSRPGEEVDYIFYIQDGDNIFIMKRAIDNYFREKGRTLPSIALVGVQSAPTSDARLAEFMKLRNDRASRYSEYSDLFRLYIVPRVEENIGIESRRTQRILVGVSAGATFSVNFALDNPDFSAAVVALSYAGALPEISDTSRFSGELPTFYLGAGLYEGSFATRTSQLCSRLTEQGYITSIGFESAGHNHTAWIPRLLDIINEIILQD